MKIITKSKMPKWLTFILPFDAEEYVLKSVIVPFMLIVMVGVWIFLYDLCGSSLDLLRTVMTLSFVGLFFFSVWWLLLHADILHALRSRLKIHYQVTEDEEDKLITQKRLRGLHMKV